MSGDPKKPEEQGAMHLFLDIVPARHQSFDPAGSQASSRRRREGARRCGSVGSAAWAGWEGEGRRSYYVSLPSISGINLVKRSACKPTFHIGHKSCKTFGISSVFTKTLFNRLKFPPLLKNLNMQKQCFSFFFLGRSGCIHGRGTFWSVSPNNSP